MAEPPSEHHIKRFKFVWRVLMISNLALGAVEMGIGKGIVRTFLCDLHHFNCKKQEARYCYDDSHLGYMFIGAKRRDIRIVSKKKTKEIGIKKHKAVVEEVPSSPPVSPPAPPSTTTNSETWDL